MVYTSGAHLRPGPQKSSPTLPTNRLTIACDSPAPPVQTTTQRPEMASSAEGVGLPITSRHVTATATAALVSEPVAADDEEVAGPGVQLLALLRKVAKAACRLRSFRGLRVCLRTTPAWSIPTTEPQAERHLVRGGVVTARRSRVICGVGQRTFRVREASFVREAPPRHG
eukprot:scaffold145003_cov72-Phaeocystis_antarctica.AAC.3